MVMLNLVAALALGENAGSLVSEKPVISLNIEGMAAKLEKASADSEKLCHTMYDCISIDLAIWLPRIMKIHAYCQAGHVGASVVESNTIQLNSGACLTVAVIYTTVLGAFNLLLVGFLAYDCGWYGVLTVGTGFRCIFVCIYD